MFRSMYLDSRLVILLKYYVNSITRRRGFVQLVLHVKIISVTLVLYGVYCIPRKKFLYIREEGQSTLEEET